MEQQCSASAVHSQRTNMARAVAQDVENEVAKSVENVFVRPEENEDNMKPEENDTDIPAWASSAAHVQGGQNENAKTAQDVENEVAPASP